MEETVIMKEKVKANMAEDILFMGDSEADELTSLASKISKVFGISAHNLDFVDKPSMFEDNVLFKLKIAGSYNPSHIYNIITSSGYSIIKTRINTK